jgi:AcrR family transcriptional regulator
VATTLRADAARNLELILEAAEAAFAEKGQEACVADIAARAGVGQATIFRRFETKDDLITAVFERKLAHVAEVADSASRKRKAWDGLVLFMTFAAELQCNDRGFFEGYHERLMAEPAVRAKKEHVLKQVDDLVERAKAEGSLREDITTDDIHRLVSAAAQASTGSNPRALKRYLQIITDGLRAGG